MKNFRIVTDSYSGYEAQVKYSLFPFAWFQLNACKGVNTWNTCEQALEFIRQKKAGTYKNIAATKQGLWSSIDFEVKSILSFKNVHRHNAIIWQDQAAATLHANFQPAF